MADRLPSLSNSLKTCANTIQQAGGPSAVTGKLPVFH
jgi:hypothetical protein